MKYVLLLLLPAILLTEAIKNLTSVPPPVINQTANATTLIGSTKIQSQHTIIFQGKQYNAFFLNEYGQISFGYEIEDADHPEYTIAPKILFSGSDHSISTVKILNETSGVSIYFQQVPESPDDHDDQDSHHNSHEDSRDSSRRRGRRLQQQPSLSYTLTFPNSTYQEMVVDFNGQAGSVQVCTKFRCPVALSSVAATKIIDCGSDSCYNSQSDSCSPSSTRQCSECDSNGCLACRKQYIRDSNGQCTVCSQNYTTVNGSCVEKVPRCQILSLDPMLCTKCFSGYSGDFCNVSTAIGSKPESRKANNQLVAIVAGVTASLLTIGLIVVVCCFKEKCRRFCCHDNQVAAQDIPMARDHESQLADKDLNTRYGNKEQQPCTICLNAECDCRTKCGHAFHRACLENWRQRVDSCPMCNKRPLSLLKACQRCRIFRIPFNNVETVCRGCLEGETIQQNSDNYIN